MRARELRPGARSSEVRRHLATRLLAERLDVSEGDDVVQIRRLRTADGTPMAVERTELSAHRFPGLEDLLAQNGSLYQVLWEWYDVEVVRASHRVSAIGLYATDAALLVLPGEPAFLIERTAYDSDNRVVEWGRSRYRGDRYDIVFDVHPGRSSAGRTRRRSTHRGPRGGAPALHNFGHCRNHAGPV